MTHRLLLVETSAALPGLLPATVWRSLEAVDVVWARDADRHPSAPYLAAAGFDVRTLAPSRTEARRNLLMTGGGDAEAVGLASALLDAAETADVAWLGDDGDESFARVVATEAARRGDVEVEFGFLMGAPDGLAVLQLADVMRRLRDPEHGCPWDLEQDHASLSRYLVEETYELLDAIADGDDRAIVEELGDVLLQVVFHAQVGSDRGAFHLDDAARGIVDKLVRRHPHVFADGDARTADEVQASWDDLKAAEKPERTGAFDGIAASQPAVPYLTALRRRAAKLGEVETDPLVLADRVEEELARVMDGVVGAAVRSADEPVGELLAAVVALAVAIDTEPETALRAAARRYRRSREGARE